MPSRDDLQAQGTVLEEMSRGAYRVELPNGHRCVARVEKSDSSPSPALGDKVLLAFHPYDLSRARIVTP